MLKKEKKKKTFIAWNFNTKHLTECALYLETVFKAVMTLKWGHRGGPETNMTDVLVRGPLTQTHTDRRWLKTQTQDRHLPAKERGLEESLPRWPGKKPPLPRPPSQTAGPQNCEKTNLCHLSHPVCGALLLWHRQTRTNLTQRTKVDVT